MKTEQQFRAHNLYKLLYKHGALSKFVNNTLYSDRSKNRDAAYEFLRNKIDYITFLERVVNIDLAFIWDKTAEGDTFWYRLHSKECKSHLQSWEAYQKMTKKH